MATILTAYAPSTAATITLANLAASGSLLAGRASLVIDNTVNKYLDIHVAGRITTGTTPTAGPIDVSVVSMLDDATWPDVFDGTDAAKTITSADIKNNICRSIITMNADTPSNRTYPFGKVSLASLFGGSLPPKMQIFVSHSTGVALDATPANHAILLSPVYGATGP